MAFFLLTPKIAIFQITLLSLLFDFLIADFTFRLLKPSQKYKFPKNDFFSIFEKLKIWRQIKKNQWKIFTLCCLNLRSLNFCICSKNYRCRPRNFSVIGFQRWLYCHFWYKLIFKLLSNLYYLTVLITNFIFLMPKLPQKNSKI